MKLFKKILSVVLSFGMIFSSTFLLRVSAETGTVSEIPKDLEECCLKLNDICTQEEKDKIKHSSDDYVNSCVRKFTVTRLGHIIRHTWLLSDGNGKSDLYNLLDDHWADFDGSGVYVMVYMILENYRRYLNGKPVNSIEDLAVDYFFKYYQFFDPELTREEIARRMGAWADKRASRKNQSLWWCAIM